MRSTIQTGIDLVGMLLKLIVYSLAHLIPRRNDLYVYSEFDSEGFSGNSKYAFLQRPDSAAEHVWIATDEALVTQLRGRGHDARYAYSARGLYTLFRTGRVFCTHGVDVPWWTTGGAEIVQFWHGNALKKVGWENPRVEERSPSMELFYRYVAWNWRYLVLTSGNPAGRFLQRTFRMADSEVIISGYPRNDALFGPIQDEAIGLDSDVKRRLEELDDGAFVFAYVPTYRQSSGTTDGLPLSEADLDYERLDAVLEANDAYLLVKLHPHSDLGVDLGRLDRIFAAESGSDAYPLLRHADCLVTDYSSIYIDYLVLDRPMIFFPYDLEEYTASRDLCFEYSEVTPGPRPRTFEELLAAIEGVSNGVDDHAGERAEVREMFHDHTDGRSAERVFRALES